jgi:DNA-binding NarL/FixJ family response regulator
LGISEDTVKHHLTKIFSALDVTNRTAAIIRAAQTGIISIRHL